MRILTDEQEKILIEERRLLQELLIALGDIDASTGDLQTIQESLQHLDDLFLLVVVGEFNAGKSAFINALFGEQLLEEGVTPTTNKINLLRYGSLEEEKIIDKEKVILTFPIDWLEDISIVDTPGTNAIIRTHEEITSQFIPRSDLVLFITSADRPFTESERLFLEKIRDWGKKVVIVINKSDILQNEVELDQVKGFVATHAQELLGIDPEIFPLSSRLALKAKQGRSELWTESRFEPLETFILDTLDEKSRLRLKLLNPLGVSTHLAEKYHEIIASRLDLLKEDLQMLDDVDAQLSIYKEDMQRNFNFRMSDIENILYEMDQRGQDYFDQTFRLSRVIDLLSKDRIKTEFEQIVVSDAPQQIDKKVDGLIDWLVDSDLREWQAVNDYLADRRRAHQDRIVGDQGSGKFHYDRERLISEVGSKAQQVVDTYDKSAEAASIAEDAQIAVAASAALEISAVGLGTLVAILATTATADITGVILASLVAALGLFVIPAKRKMAKSEMRQKINELREKLMGTLRTQFSQEIERSLLNINTTIAPYTRFVRAERGKYTDVQSKLDGILAELYSLKQLVEKI